MPSGVYPHKRGPESPHWKPDDEITVATGHWRAAQVLYPGEHVCQREGCGKRAQRHHVDANPKNNAPENIEFWCPKHHAEREDRGRFGRGRPATEKMRATSRRTMQAMNRARKGVPLSAERRAAISALTRESWRRRKEAALGIDQ